MRLAKPSISLTGVKRRFTSVHAVSQATRVKSILRNLFCCGNVEISMMPIRKDLDTCHFSKRSCSRPTIQVQG